MPILQSWPTHSISLSHLCSPLAPSDQFEVACLILYTSKFIGYSMIIVSFFLKLPQILKILKAKSAKGISLATFYMDSLSYSLMSAYCMHKGQPISTYGEHISVLVQCIVLVVLYWKVEKVSYQYAACITFLFIVAWCLPLTSGVITEEFWSLVPLLYTVFSVTGKLAQIQENFTNKSTGNLSFFTNFVTFLGSASRVFTTLAELNDNVLLLSYVVGGVLKGVIVSQFFTYRSTKLD